MKKCNVTKKFLQKRYPKKPAPQIAKELGCSFVTIYNYLRIYKIPIRTISESHKGKNNGRYIDGRSLITYYCIEFSCNKIVSESNRRCKSCARRFYYKEHPNFNKGKNNPNFGKRGKLSHSYIHGKGFEPYSEDFSNYLKKQIRKRDNYSCQICKMSQKEHLIIHNEKLPIHHIDYNKQNCNKNNLISLCFKCHMNTNSNRKYWTKYLKEKMAFVERAEKAYKKLQENNKLNA